ncbi:uncharacterized protein LDX57_013059 [Aspergillus melleus]|nr:uncharacterized protein LDX57_013059 [Aspergillus melleus]KAH8427030.1 hypothetical protein LDX57_013059 [Aspergillus melleus]
MPPSQRSTRPPAAQTPKYLESSASLWIRMATLYYRTHQASQASLTNLQ